MQYYLDRMRLMSASQVLVVFEEPGGERPHIRLVDRRHGVGERR